MLNVGIGAPSAGGAISNMQDTYNLEKKHKTESLHFCLNTARWVNRRALSICQ